MKLLNKHQNIFTFFLPNILMRLEQCHVASGAVDRVVPFVTGKTWCATSRCSPTSKPLSDQPLQQSTRNQDRGGLLYPSNQLVYVFNILCLFMQSPLKRESKLQKPLKTLQAAAVPAIVDSGLLSCPQSDQLQHQDLAKLICLKFIRPLLINYASTAINQSDVYKSFSQKPHAESMLSFKSSLHLLSPFVPKNKMYACPLAASESSAWTCFMPTGFYLVST